MEKIGTLCFGLVIGWITYRTLSREESVSVTDITSVIAAVGGAGIIKLFSSGDLFYWYCIGLAVGFFTYYGIAIILVGKGKRISMFLMDKKNRS